MFFGVIHDIAMESSVLLSLSDQTVRMYGVSLAMMYSVLINIYT